MPYGTLYGMPVQRLTPEQITAAALDLVDSVGPDALSMRALADRLDVGTMTLYGYFRSRDELLDAVVDAATADAVIDHDDAPPPEALHALFSRLYQVLTRHPGLHRLRGSRPFLSPGILRLTDRALGLLLAAGLDGTAATRAYRTLYLFTLGCASYAAADPGATERALAALPDSSFTHLRRLAPAMVATAGSPDEFPSGLTLLVKAVTSRPH